MSYKFIIHPNNEKLYSIHSRVGRQLIQGYLQQHGGEVNPDRPEELPGDVPETGAPKPVPEPKADAKPVDAADINVDVDDDVDAKPEKKVVSLEDPIRARIKAQWAPWVARWEQLVELLRGNKTKEGQSGGNGDYMKNVLTFIV